MKNIRLYIGGKRADLDGSLNIPFTYQTSDSQMPTAVKNSYSKTVNLQGTEQNRRIFDGLWRLDSRVKDVKAREPEYIADYTETDAEFTSRAVPSAAQGDVLKATAVKGKSVVWNQLVQPSSWSTTLQSLTLEKTGYEFTVNGSVTSFASTYLNTGAVVPDGHKALYRYRVLSGSYTGSFRVGAGYGGTSELGTGVSLILTRNGGANNAWCSFQAGTSCSSLHMTVEIIDLTAAGLDDLTAAEFETLYPDYHSYNAGELVNNAASGVEMLDAGGNSLGTLSTPITEIVPADKPTVRLNQHIVDNTYNYTSNGITFKYNASGIYSLNGTATANANFTMDAPEHIDARIPQNHKALYWYQMLSGTYTGTITVGAGYGGTIALTKNTSMIATRTDGGNFPYISVRSGAVATNVTVRIMVIDLTEMYGAGNEPTSTAEVEELIGSGYIPYTTGEDIPNRIFPVGMKSAGSVADEWSGSTATKRIGVVDLGTLTWVVQGSGGNNERAYSTGLRNIAVYSPDNVVGNIICADFASATAGDTYSHASNNITAIGSTGNLWIYSTSLVGLTAAQIKAALSGVLLYYELATPIEYTTDQPLPGTLAEFESGGTMRRLPVDTAGSVLAPFVGSFEYGHIQTYPMPYHFNPMKRVPFLLYVDEMVVERGYCQLVAINRKSRGYTFSLSLFGGLGEFFYNLQTDADGETKSLADLDFGQDLGFTINAAKVQEVWDDLIAGNLPTIGFVPMHNGAPSSVDGKKALIKGGGLPTSIVDGSDTYSQKLGYILASLERKYTEWEIGDLRSYLQRPALRFKDFLAAVCNPANNGGWTVNLDSGFFNEDNPYYEKTYLLLPQLNVEESTDEICDDGSVQAVSDYPATATKVKTLQPVSSCLTLDGTYIDLSGSASNAYVKVSLPIQLAVTGLANQGDLYLTNRVSHHTENKTICMMAAAYDEGGSLLAVSNRYVFTSKSHRNETGDVKKPAAPVATTDAQIDGYFTYQGGEYVFRTDDNAANIFALVIDKIPRPSSSGHKIQVRFYIQMTTDGIPTLNTKRKGENSSNVNVSNTQFSCRILEGSNNNVSLVEPTQYASDSRVSQEALLNSLEQSPLEILLSYTKTFGLMWIQDNLQNSVSLYKRENYYTGEVSDIHNRIDYGKGWKATPVSAESNNYTLENEYPETTLSKAYESDYGRTYGGVRLKVGYDFGKEKIETMEKVELKGYVEGALSGSGYWKYRNADGNLPSPIADGMKVTYYKESGGETQTKDVEYNLFNVTAITKTNSPALGVACLNEDGEEKAVEVAPALVMLQGGAMGGTFYLSDDVAAMATLNNGPCWIWDESRSAARIPRFARVATFDGETYSLDFGTPRMTYYIPEVSLAPEQAVYARYWEKYLTDLLDRNTKKVECYVVFPPHLDMRQEMRKFYLFDRTLWVLNKVTDYDATKEQSVKCEFIRVNLKGNYVNE